jgi:hypothetical protein
MSYYNPYNVSALTDRLRGDSVNQTSEQLNKVEKHSNIKQGPAYYGIGPGQYRTMPYPIYNDHTLTDFLAGDAAYQKQAAEIRNQLLVQLLTQNNERYSALYWNNKPGTDLPPTFMSVPNEQFKLANTPIKPINSPENMPIHGPENIPIYGPENITKGGPEISIDPKTGIITGGPNHGGIAVGAPVSGGSLTTSKHLRFGNLSLNSSKLNSGVFSAVRTTTNKAITDLPSRPISNELMKAVQIIMTTHKLPRNLDQLNFDEQMWLKKLTDKSKVGVNIPLPAKQLLEKLKVDLGSIQSGNNSELLRIETLKIIELMKKNNLLTKQLSQQIKETL